MDHSRRDFIRKSAAAGGLVWAAPAIATISTASAQSVSPCACLGRSRAILATGSLLGGSGLVDTGFQGNVGCVPGQVISAGDLEAELGCPSFDAGSCSQSVTIVSFEVGDLSATNIVATATGPTSQAACPDYSGTVTFDSLSLGSFSTSGSVTPNTTVSGTIDLGSLGSVSSTLVLNEQGCDGGEWVVRAIHLTAETTVGGILLDAEVIVGEARVRSTCCDCVGPPLPLTVPGVPAPTQTNPDTTPNDPFAAINRRLAELGTDVTVPNVSIPEITVPSGSTAERITAPGFRSSWSQGRP